MQFAYVSWRSGRKQTMKSSCIGTVVTFTGQKDPMGNIAQTGSAMEAKRDEDRECFYCKNEGHFMRDCRKKGREEGESKKIGFSRMRYGDVSPGD
ncbi:unnamed protein product [Peronospora destructor]|uniref:CCHC-type domain-containing protein n=1 Tax=Peronospora destructor TaxID=86335 RepID=A0AAV0URX3_9STRA|nr:unnamed protein product [Peronospora destructor]